MEIHKHKWVYRQSVTQRTLNDEQCSYTYNINVLLCIDEYNTLNVVELVDGVVELLLLLLPFFCNPNNRV